MDTEATEHEFSFRSSDLFSVTTGMDKEDTVSILGLAFVISLRVCINSVKALSCCRALLICGLRSANVFSALT